MHTLFFALSDGYVVFRLAPRRQLRRDLDHSVVAFSADHLDRDSQSGWSVLVRGVAEEVSDPGLVASLLALPLRAWGDPADGDSFVRVPIDHISGTSFRWPTAISPPSQVGDHHAPAAP